MKAARKHLCGFNEPLDRWTWNVSWWSDPVLLGHYPEEGLRKYEKYLPKITKDDMKLIAQPTDFYGQNLYNGSRIRMGQNGSQEAVEHYDDYPKTALNWPVTPECLYWGPKFFMNAIKKQSISRKMVYLVIT